jgi:Zn-dependent peptidase ImmA (M78 family)
VKRPDKRKPVAVVVRRNVNVERNRFTLAHELAHAAIGECANGKPEKAMDRFAAAFLMPADHLRKEIGRSRRSLGYNELVELKHLYGVSMMALLMRLRDIDVISESDLKNLYRSPARSWLKSEPEPLSEHGEIAKLERPRRFEAYVYRALAEHLIPSSRAAAILRKPTQHVEAAVQGPIELTGGR